MHRLITAVVRYSLRHLALWSKDGTSTTAGWFGYMSSLRSSLSNDL